VTLAGFAITVTLMVIASRVLNAIPLQLLKSRAILGVSAADLLSTAFGIFVGFEIWHRMKLKFLLDTQGNR
jgi:hypothetical protein